MASEESDGETAQTTAVFVIGGSITGADVPGLCERLRACVEASEADIVVCDVAALFDPDAAAVEALARLQLTARRLGRRIRLCDASSELQELVAFVGLSDVVPAGPRLLLEPSRQAEEREQPRRIEEGVEPDDPTA